MIERWRKWRFDRVEADYRRRENAGAAGDDLLEASAWIGGGWTPKMIAALPTAVLEHGARTDGPVSQDARVRIARELDRRRSTRAEKVAYLSLLVAIGSLLAALFGK